MKKHTTRSLLTPLQKQGVFKVGGKLHFLVQFIERLLLALKFISKRENYKVLTCKHYTASQ